MQYPLGGYNQDYESRIARTDALNCHLEPNVNNDFFRVRRVAGRQKKFEVGLGPIRGMFEIQNEVFVVSRNKLYKIDINEVVTELGDVGGSTTKVDIDANGADDNQIIVISDGRGFIYDEASGTPFQEITDPDFVAGYGVASLNQIFWVPQPNSNTIQGSDTANGLSWSATRKASAEQNPDILVKAVAVGSYLWFMGQKTVEYWQTDQTDTTVPIRPVAGATIQRGVAARDSIAKFQNNVFWLADDLTVWRISGNQADKISDLNIEYAIRGDGKNAGYTDPKSARGFFIDHPVHKMYVLTFRADKATWIYNVNTGLWHRRETGDLGFWGGQESVLFNNQVLVGDWRSNDIWLFTEEEFSDGNGSMKIQLVPPAIRNKNTDTIVESVELFMETGVGSISGIDDFGILKADTQTPLVQFEYSKDGGASWASKPDVSFGKVGQRDIRVKSRLFGRVRKEYAFMLRFTITDDAPVEMYELHVNMSEGG